MYSIHHLFLDSICVASVVRISEQYPGRRQRIQPLRSSSDYTQSYPHMVLLEFRPPDLGTRLLGQVGSWSLTEHDSLRPVTARTSARQTLSRNVATHHSFPLARTRFQFRRTRSETLQKHAPNRICAISRNWVAKPTVNFANHGSPSRKDTIDRHHGSPVW